MDTLLFWLLILAVGAGIVWWLTKTGRVADRDGDHIPDVVEDAAATVKRRAKRVAEEAGDVVDAVVDAAKQTTDIVDAAKGGPRKGRKPSAKKTADTKSTTTKRGRPKKGGSGGSTDVDTKI